MARHQRADNVQLVMHPAHPDLPETAAVAGHADRRAEPVRDGDGSQVASVENLAHRVQAQGAGEPDPSAHATGAGGGARPPADGRPGTLFLIVGPSGVGKDTLIDAARDALAGDRSFVFARRVITRPAEAGGEAHEPMDDAAFAHARAEGTFAVTWSAHNLHYGVRTDVADALRDGRNVVLNASRRAIPSCAALTDRVVVVSITAPAEVVRQRLLARGREDADAVAARLARTVPLAGTPDVIEVDNGGDLATAVRTFLAVLRERTG